MPTFLSQLIPALKLFWKNRLIVALCGLIDIAFFIALAFVHYEVLRRLASHVQAFLEEVQKATLNMLTQEDPMMLRQSLLKSASFMSAYHQILKFMIILLIAMLLTWVVFKSINWYFACRIVKGKVDFKGYIKYFVLYSLLWFLGLIIILVVFVSLTSYSTSSVLPLIGSTGTSIISFVLLLLLTYFAFISYSLIPKIKFKEIFKTGFRKWKQIVPAYLITAILTFLAAYIPIKIALWQHPAAYWIVLAFVIFISLPALSYGRIYISLIVNKEQIWIKKS